MFRQCGLEIADGRLCTSLWGSCFDRLNEVKHIYIYIYVYVCSIFKLFYMYPFVSGYDTGIIAFWVNEYQLCISAMDK